MGNESEERHRAAREAIAARMRADNEAAKKRQEAEHRRIMDEHHQRQLQQIENNKRITQQKKAQPAASNTPQPVKYKRSSFKIFLAISLQFLVTCGSWLLFIFSFTMVAYSDLTGLKCAEKCLNSLPFQSDLGFWRIYYSLFNFVNLIFSISPLIVIWQAITGSNFKKIKWVYILALMQVISWPILHIVLAGENTSNVQEIRSGYYTWLLSMIITTFSAFSINNIEKSRY